MRGICPSHNQKLEEQHGIHNIKDLVESSPEILTIIANGICSLNPTKLIHMIRTVVDCYTDEDCPLPTDCHAAKNPYLCKFGEDCWLWTRLDSHQL